MHRLLAGGGTWVILFVLLFALSASDGMAQTARKPASSVAVPPGANVTIQGTTARISGAGASGDFSCTCNKGKGACKVFKGPTSIICDFAETNACTGDCVIVTTSGGAAARGGAVRAPATTIAPAVK